MNKKVKVSVIMGVFNPGNAKSFMRAVRSIMRQTLQEWELILYDDGSKEACAGIIRQAAALDPRIRYVRDRRNCGLAHALNECIWQSKGRYIARMDDDDVSRPDRLEKQADFLENHVQYQWVGSNAQLTDRQGVWGYQKMPEAPEKKDFLFNSPYIHPSVMFRKEILLQSGGYSVDSRNSGCEDYELFMRLQASGARGYNIQEPLLQYHEDYAAHRKRTYRRRIREMGLRFRGFKEMGILDGYALRYVLKPLLVGVVPPPVHHYINRRLKRDKGEG